MDEDVIVCRVQYLLDGDPFDGCAIHGHPEPSRAPRHAFSADLPLANQMGTLLRLLGAPHRVGEGYISNKYYEN